MANFVRSLLARVYLDHFAHDLLAISRDARRTIAWRARRDLAGVDRRLRREYFGATGVRTLNLGCGRHPLPGWLNSDYHPESDRELYLDVRRPFPFEPSTFEYVYCEHMIEHLTPAQAAFMLRECVRVLRPGGRLRLATPNLVFLIEMYRGQKSLLQTRYLAWAAQSSGLPADEADDVYLINHFVRAWGHRFIYDEKSLRRAMERAGFSEITVHRPGESATPELRNLENLRQMPAEFYDLETLILEGSAPRGG
jgi:predicted SAM-dependent methyltransferase